MAYDAVAFLEGLFKPEDDGLLADLARGIGPDDLPGDWRVEWEERAAIMEYDGGLPRERAEGGRLYREYQAQLTEELGQSELRWCKVEDLAGVDFRGHDVVFLDTFLDEVSFLEIYGAANVVVLPYLDLSQISSGILAETLGCGRIAIATKFRCALELIHSNKPCSSGLVIGRYARGILVDPGEASVEQIARALDLVVFNEDMRLRMEKQAHQRGYQMGWHNSAWALLQQVGFVSDKKEMVAGRGPQFLRAKPSILGE